MGIFDPIYWWATGDNVEYAWKVVYWNPSSKSLAITAIPRDDQKSLPMGTGIRIV